MIKILGRSPARRTRAMAAFCVLLSIAPLSVLARQLSGIDRLADAPAQATGASLAASVQAQPADLQVHERLGVPTFLWGSRPGRGGAPALASSIVARIDASGSNPEQAARLHLHNLRALYALTDAHIDALPALYTQPLPNGGALVKFRNAIDSIEVFREEAGVLLDADRQLVAIGGFVSSGEIHGTFVRKPAAAIAVALADWSFDARALRELASTETRDGYEFFALPESVASADGSRLKSPIRAKPVLFRLPTGLRPAYYVEVQVLDGTQPGAIDGYAYVVDANDLSVLFRHNQTAHASFSYRVFAEAGGNNLPLPSPAGRNGFPHPTGTPDGYQAPFVSTNLITLQNLPFSRDDPWLPVGATQTTGNNVEAFADLAEPDNFSSGDLRATTTSPGVFDRAYDTAATPAVNDTQIMAAVTNLFYINNWLHDWYYDAGFNEVSGNAQTDNYGRGGLGNDSIFAEALDFAGRDNADMLTPADGERPRMRMYVFDGSVMRAIVNTPASIAGPKAAAGAAYGPQTYNVTGNVVYASPADGCSPMSAAVNGKVALIDDPVCNFEVKTLNAQNAGAIGVIIVSSSNFAYTMGDDPSVSGVSIPSVMFMRDDGTAIKGQLPAPGVNVTLQMATSLDRDGSVDNTIVAHEWGHYISNRLISNASGLSTNHSYGLAEGWADFHALLLLVKAGDAALPNNAGFSGTYATGAYVLSSTTDPNNQGYYYGSRRYPYSRDMNKNPLTFRHITNGVALPASPPSAFGADGSDNAEMHNTGEVWASMLWECYSNLLNDTSRLTFAQAQDRMKRYLVAGYKLTPYTPTLIEARDALLAAIASQDSADYALCYQGFAKRGAGAGAVAPDRFSADNSGVVESFVAGGALSVLSVTLSDLANACDADGYLDNGESGTLDVTIRNTGSTSLTATTGSVSNGNAHLSFPSGTTFNIPSTQPGQVVVATVPVQLASAVGVETATLTVSIDDPALTIPRPVVTSVSTWVNADEKASQSGTDSVEPKQTVWTTGTTSTNPAALRWQRIAISGSDHRWHGPDAGFPQLTWLQSPPLHVAPTGTFSFTFKHRHYFEYEVFHYEILGIFFDVYAYYDGGQIQISNDNGITWTSIGAAATPSYNGTLETAGSNPLAGQDAYVKYNVSFPSLDNVTVNLGTNYAGQTVLIRFVIGSDDYVAQLGWEIDDIAFSNITNTPFAVLVPHAGVCLPTAGADIDANSSYDALTDGLLLMRYLFGLTGTSLTENALGPDARRTNPAFILSYLDSIRPSLDIDGNGQEDALTDGLMLLRYLSGLRGAALVNGAIGLGATRTTAATIETYIQGLLP